MKSNEGNKKWKERKKRGGRKRAKKKEGYIVGGSKASKEGSK